MLCVFDEEEVCSLSSDEVGVLSGTLSVFVASAFDFVVVLRLRRWDEFVALA